MANRVVLTWNSTYGFTENLAASDNIDMQTAGKVVNLASATSAGDALAYGQSGASLAGLALTGNLAMGGNLVTGLGTPLDTGDAATKGYVDGLVNGVQWKSPANALSDSNVASLSGLATVVDNVSLNTDGMRVLLTGQSTGSQNGLWVVHSGAWTRPTDFSVGSHQSGSACLVEQGDTYRDTAWTCTSDPPTDVVGTDSLTFSQFGSVVPVTASYGLVKVANDIRANPGDGLNLSAGNTYLQVNLDTNPGLVLNGVSPAKKLAALADPSGGLQVVAAGIQVKIVSTNQLVSSASGLDVAGVPAQFKVAGSATSVNVTASNLNTLTAGSNSDATSLHNHTSDKFSAVTVDALAAGDPVYWSSTSGQLGKALANNDAKSFVCGINDNNSVLASGTATPVRGGRCAGVLASATPGSVFYLQPTGGISTSIPGAGGNNIVQCGFAITATDLFVAIQRFGKRV